ncbi:MAG: SDR family oxidoreductase [Opitutaceae bacterium]|nr:SDR family oxidoreductase [Opitutaceae bacterium]
MTLQGKAAVITGAARGVGRATALQLARLGCAVLVNYHRSRDAAERTAADVRALGVQAVCHQGSVADDAACRAMMDAAAQAFGRIDILVNNAGTTRFITLNDLEAVKDEDWNSILMTNLKGTFQCARAARRHLEASDMGTIVNVASIAGIGANGSSIPYSASKAGVINLTVSLARALAPRIRVNAVAPGLIEGEWVQEGLGDRYEAALKARIAQTPLGRVCKPDDVAATIVSLITGSSLVTGQTLIVDGGCNLGMR